MYCILVKLIIIIPICYGCQINYACVVSDLGLEIYSSLKYDARTNKIVGKAFSRFGVLFKGFTCSSLKESVLDLCKTCSGIRFKCMGPLSNKTYNALEKVQKHFTKRILSLANQFYPDRLAAR